MSKISTVIFITLVALVPAVAGATGMRPDPLKAVSGVWYTDDRDGAVQLYPCGGEICGLFYWLEDDSPGHVSRDTRNHDSGKRRRPLCRMPFMGGFTPDGHGHYTNGWIYSPHDGNTYSAELTLVGRDTLDLRGYLLLPALGESRTWTRAKNPPACATANE